MTTNSLPKLSADSLALFVAIVEDLPNWSGYNVPLDGITPTFNHIHGKTDPAKGHLTDLKRKKLVESFKADGDEWIKLTALGLEFAKSEAVPEAMRAWVTKACSPAEVCS